MPQPVSAGQRYLPGLDGLRALAVLAVLAYHEQLGWAQGGLLGVGVFFTLSGFLITSLLIGQWSAESRLRLGDFWLRRARRLLPALFVMLALVTTWITIADRARLAALRGAAGAAAAYFSNWYLIAANQSYFARFAPPAPLDHLWSLAVEEQFYLLWPLLLLGGLAAVRGRSRAAVRWLIVPTLALAAASALLMIGLYQPGMDPTRVYEGTDTRACGLLVGAALAMAWPASGAAPGRRSRLVIDGAGIAGLIIIGVMIWRVGQYSPFAYRGGMALLSVATAAVVAATAAAGTGVGRVLGWRPLRWIGERSYGIYLWHFPVIVLTTPPNTGRDLPRAAVQTVAAVGLAALSWRFVEEPIRHGAIERLLASVRAAGWRLRSARLGNLRAAGTVATTAGATGVLLVAGAGLSGAIAAPASGAGFGLNTSAGPLQQPVTRSVVRGDLPRTGAGRGAPGTGAGASGAGAGGSGAGAGRSGAAGARPGTSGWQWGAGVRRAGPGPAGYAGGGPLRTSCPGVAHIGDSTSDGLNSPVYLPDPRQRIVARYEDVGARMVVIDIEGARSIVEVLPGGVNAYDAAKTILRNGFRGCWVLAMGTDDTADVAVGSNYTLAYRIQSMMAATRGMPVMWVNVKSLLVSGPYAESNMQRWNAALLSACARYPNMRIYDWASEVDQKWFISDGIHYSSLGYAHRAQMIADALAVAFPQGGQSSGCVVHS